MLRFLNLIMRGIDRLAEWGFYAGAFLMLALPLIMSYEVGMRYFFKRPTAWASDFSSYFLVYATFFAAGWLLRQKEHISMVFVIDHLHGNVRWIFIIIQSLMGIFACGFMFWSGVVGTWDSLTRWVLIVNPLTIPRFTIVWVIPFGGLMLSIYFTVNLFNSLAALLKRSQADLVDQIREKV